MSNETNTRPKPTVANIRRRNGVAGWFSYTVDVTYPREETERLEFVGNAYARAVTMVTPTGRQLPVTDPGRFGDKLTPEWVRRFFGVGQ